MPKVSQIILRSWQVELSTWVVKIRNQQIQKRSCFWYRKLCAFNVLNVVFRYLMSSDFVLKFFGPGMCRNRPGIVPMLATTFLCSVYISVLRRYFAPLPWRFLAQPELQQGSDRLNCNQKHFLILYAIKLIVYTSTNKSWSYFRVICAPIRSWSDAIYPGRHPVSISEKTSHLKISWSLEAARIVFRIVRSLWNFTGTRQHCCQCAC